MQAADGVGDSKFEDWAAKAWSLLLDLPVPPSSMAGAKEIFLNLPDHIQHLVFMAGARSCQQRGSLKQLLRMLPERVHPSVVAAFVGPEGVLEVPSTDSLYTRGRPFFKALRCLPAAPPPVLSLIDLDISMPGGDPPACDEDTEAAAAALRHHSGLTSLKLVHLSSSAKQLRLIAPAIAALPELKTLQLGTDRFPVRETSLSILSDAFQSIGPLEHLITTIDVTTTSSKPTDDASTDPNPSGNKFRRIDPSSTALDDQGDHSVSVDFQIPYSEYVLRLLSRVTSLTFLSLSTPMCSFRPEYDTAIASMPVHMPYLETLLLEGYASLVPVNVVSNITAPLKALTVELLAPECPQQFCVSIQQFVHLTCLSLKFIHLKDPDQSSLCQHIPAMFSALRQLKKLDINTSITVLLAMMPSVAADLSQLSFEVSSCSYVSEGNANEQPGFIRERWVQLCAMISQVPLHNLQIYLSEPFQQHHLPGIVHLSALTGLTSLCLLNWGSCLGDADDTAALSQMSQLQRLHLTGIEPQHATASFGALVSLQHLRELVIHAQRRHDVIPGADAQHQLQVPPGAWRSLSSLEFPVLSGASACKLVVSAIQLPAIRKIQILPRGRACLSRRDEEQLLMHAEQQGVHLHLGWFLRP